MNNIKNKLNKGFTLIELMVVISIITFLSSIILVSVKDVRERAKGNAFRASVNQFIIALELYKNDKGVYPGQQNPEVAFTFIRVMEVDGVITTSTFGVPIGFTNFNNYITAMTPYIKDLPTPVKPSTTFRYGHALTALNAKCLGDKATSSYVIQVSSTQSGFEDWAYATLNGVSAMTTLRCFSLK